MAQNTISTAILIIAGVIAAAALINAAFPSLYNVAGSVTSVSESSSDRAKTDISIVSEGLDDGGSLHVYVKNTGRLAITAPNLAKTDVYYGTGSTMYQSQPLQYVIRDDNGNNNLDPGETLDITITAAGYDFTADQQSVAVVLYNGASASDTYRLE